MRKFIDTAPFIYLIEDHPSFADKVIQLISDALIHGDTFMTSVITVLEFSVKPEMENRQDIILKFHELLDKLNCQIEEVDLKIATKSYQLKAKYPFLKSMDAIQISTALLTDCVEFITNDNKLAQIDEIKITLINKQ
jgi:predicted nucleic acid-binding protein